MIKLTNILKEIDFQSEEPSAFENEKEAIQDYINVIKQYRPQGITMADVAIDMPKVSQAIQFKTLIELAKVRLLNLSSNNKVKLRPSQVMKIIDDKFGIAIDAMINPNLNEYND
jgi:hypothetical protein